MKGADMDLPQPDHYSVSELADYWCRPQAVVQRYILSDWLRPAFYFGGVVCTYTPFELIGVAIEEMELHEQILVSPVPWQGTFTLTEELSDLLCDSGLNATIWGGWCIDVKHCLFTDAHKASIIPQVSTFFRSNDVVITRYEVERFEKECCHTPLDQPEAIEELISREKENGVRRDSLALKVYDHPGGTDYYIGLALHNGANVEPKALTGC